MIKDNKVSKYLLYATGEIILVVIGILIALQINNWNENRKNSIKETEILRLLHSDFLKNLAEFNHIKALHLNSLEKQDIVLRNISKLPQSTARDTIVNYGKGMFGGYTFNPSNGTVESLISSGDINLIKNDSLRNYLVSWKDVLGDYCEEERLSQQFWDNIIEPYLVQKGFFYNPEDPRNFKLIQDTVFLSMIVRKRHLTNNILNEIQVDNSIEDYLNEIVRLSKVN